MTVNERPIDRLRYHVTGAIERGEAVPIVEVSAAHVAVNERREPRAGR